MMAVDFGGIVDSSKKLLFDPLSRQIGYLKKLSQNMERLRAKMKLLSSKAADISTEVCFAERKDKKPLEEVLNWLKEVESKKAQVSDIEKQFEERNRRKGPIPKCQMRRKISKKSSILATQVEELIANGSFESGVSFEQQPQVARIIPTASIMGRTANSTLEEIWNWILSKEKRIIGVHGMGGVGKTTIMENINNRLIEEKNFDDIIWVDVPNDIDEFKLQMKMIKKLEISLTEDHDDRERQTKIYNALKKRNKFLLILDDMWNACSLVKVGIPDPNERNGCKIIFTTRNKRVCGAMRADGVQVKLLSEEESWELFKENVGGVVCSEDIEGVAKDVARECGHLPMAIVSVGKAMSGVDNVNVWRCTLKNLKDANHEVKGMEDVFGQLRVSYTQLQNKIHQSCFLYCSLYPEEYEIPTIELIDYWICEGLIEEGTREDDIHKGHQVLDTLIKASMLELPQSGGKYERVRMHDLIRDMAIRITRVESPRSIINAGVKLEGLPADWPEDAERISLMHNLIEKLLDQPKSSKLLTLLLQENPLKTIPKSYFNHMSLLKVLDLSGTKIKSLPESISNLKNLRALLLRKCKLLKEVSSLSELDQLRLLDLSETSIQELPAGMKAMVKLQRLNLNRTRELRLFPAGIISELTRLEELTMYRSRWTWSQMQGEGATIKEIMNSNKLVHLNIDFKDLSNFLRCINSEKWQILKSFSLGIGSHKLEVAGTSQWKYIVEVRDCDVDSKKNSLLIPKNTEWLNIIHGRISSLCHFTHLLGNTELYGCFLYNIDETKFLMEEGEALLPSLKFLCIRSLCFLRGLCKGIPSPDALKSLKSLQIGDCNNLEYLFPARLLQQLRSLKHIVVLSCDAMKEIVAEEEETERGRNDNNNTTMVLSQLKTLKMWELPELKGICSRALVCNALKTINVKRCPELKKLPFSEDYLPCALKKIIGGNTWWHALEWNDSKTKDHLQPFHECP